MTVELNTNGGKFIGTSRIVYDRHYVTFLRIPYAIQPRDNRRFTMPKTSNVTNVVINGRGHANKHPGSDDCLFLNIYTPGVADDGCRPVMVFVPGIVENQGKCLFSTYDPAFFMLEDVVVVVVSYRRGICGFANVNDDSMMILGNAGLHDIVKALKFLRMHINNFGGDQNNVTLWGQGFGAACVHHLALKYKHKQNSLFHKVILQSGTVLNSWAFKPHQSEENVVQYARTLGFVGDTPKEAIGYLEKLPIDDLTRPEQKYNPKFYGCEPSMLGPTIDHSFLHRSPQAYINDAVNDLVNPLPILMGYNSCEGMIAKSANNKIFKQPRTYETAVINEIYQASGGAVSKKQIKTQISDTYSRTKGDPSDIFLQFLSDNYFVRHIIETALTHKRNNPKTSIYFYKFCFDGRLNFMKKNHRLSNRGACHGDELGYLFRTRETVDNFSPEFFLRCRMINHWANFARCGIPDHDLSPYNVWKPMGSSEFHYMEISSDFIPMINPDGRRMKCWSCNQDSIVDKTLLSKDYVWVETACGNIKGRIHRDDGDGSVYYGFYRLPYSKPDQNGESQFDAFVHLTDAHIINCYLMEALQPDGSPCKDQTDQNPFWMNIYTNLVQDASESLKPETINLPRRPVIVFIASEPPIQSFTGGELFCPKDLVHSGAVVVDLSYRTRIRGNLNSQHRLLGAPEDSGSRDILIALSNMRLYIQQFSGDPKNITLWGQGFGAVLVHYLYLLARTRKLFHKVIIQSDSTIHEWACGNRGATTFAEKLGLDHTNEESLLERFRKVSLEDLVRPEWDDRTVILRSGVCSIQ